MFIYSYFNHGSWSQSPGDISRSFILYYGLYFSLSPSKLEEVTRIINNSGFRFFLLPASGLRGLLSLLWCPAIDPAINRPHMFESFLVVPVPELIHDPAPQGHNICSSRVQHQSIKYLINILLIIIRNYSIKY